ncbi:MAG: ATP-grasp domain-containing protein, partial [Bacteroidales bacterium]
NWGNSRFNDARVFGHARVLNSPEAIRRASMKTDAMAAMQAAGVPIVESTTDRSVAQGWMDAGSLVYARTVLQGHSGEGIVMAHTNPSEINGVGNAFTVQSTLPQARLYTKGILLQRREFRIHVMNGTVTYVQQKKRADGAQERPEYSNVVRNYHTGWIYASSDVRPNDAALRAAVDAVAALGLDFGAVDVITRRDDAWVLEVNTAPGLQGTNLSTYAENFCRLYRGEEVVSVVGEVAAAPVAPVPEVQEAMATLSNTESVPVPSVQPTPAFIPEPAPAPIRPAPIPAPVAPVMPTRRAGSAVHEAFYEATLNGTRIIVQYNEEVSGFYMPGWEIPLINNREGLVVDLSRVI